jgi:agmatinase
MRGLGSARREEVEFARDWGAHIVTARDLHRNGLDAVMAHVPAGVNCVITLDCDALDAGIMPAVMSPTPGGLSYMQAIDLVAAVTSKARLVAFDMIEFVRAIRPARQRSLPRASNVIGHIARSAK